MIEYTKQKIGDLDCVFVSHPNATDQPDAVVILCHGFGAPGTDLVPVANEMIANSSSLDNVRFVFPAAPIELDPHYDSRAWWMIDVEKIQQLMMTGEARQMRHESPAPLPACSAAIRQIIDFCKTEFGVRAEQIVVGGFSQGSMLMTDVALHYSESLGGLIVWSGALINEENWKSAAAGNGKSLNVVQSHGRIDPILPFEGAEQLRDFLVENNHNVNFVEFNGQHAIPPETLDAAKKLIEDVVTRCG